MPVFEITDGAGRTLELEGDHEPTAQELESIFKEAFPQEKIQPMTQEAADKAASSQRTVRGEFEKQGQQFNEALFKPFAGVKKLVDEAIPSFVPETPEMQQLIGMTGLGQAQQTAAGVSERVKGAVESVASPGGVMLAGAAPAAPAVVGPVVAGMVTPQAIEGVKELGRGEIALGLTDLALTAPVIAGGTVSGARGLASVARSKTTASRIPESPVDPSSTLQGATKTFEETIVKPALDQATVGGKVGNEQSQILPSDTQNKGLGVAQMGGVRSGEKGIVGKGATEGIREKMASETKPSLSPVESAEVLPRGIEVEFNSETIDATEALRDRFDSKRRTAHVFKFPDDKPTILYRGISQQELNALRANPDAPILGGTYSVPLEREYGAQWAASPEEAMRAAFHDEKVKGVEGQRKYLIAVDARGQTFAHIDPKPTTTPELANRNRYVIDPSRISGNLEVSIKVPYSKTLWTKEIFREGTKGGYRAEELASVENLRGGRSGTEPTGTKTVGQETLPSEPAAGGGIQPWLREAMEREGLDPNRTFNDVDLGNPSVRDAIMADPTLTDAQKQHLLKTGSLPKEPAAEGGAAPAAPKTETPAGKVEPAGGSLGVTPNPVLAKLMDIAVPRQQGTPPPLQLDTSTNFPDFSPIDVANKNFARAFGVGRVPVLGWLFDPNARIRLPFQESLGRYFSERFDVARAQASAVGEMIRGRIDKAFTIDQAGRLKGVEGKEGKDPFWVDAFEAEEARPGSYNFNPEQRAALQVWLDLKKEAEPLMEKYKLTREMDDEAMAFDDMLALEPQKGEGKKGYAPRIVRERPAQTARVGTGGVGSKASFEKPRLFPTMREGFEKGVRYEPSPEASIATWSERLYKRIADKRLAEDPNLGAVPVAEKRAELREYYADKVASGEWTPERLDQTVESVISQGRVDQPAFAGKFLDPEIAVAVNKAFPKGQHFMWRELANTTSFLKGLKFGFDWGAPMIQGLPTFLKAFTSPRDAKAWANGVAGMIKAQFSAEALPLYVKNNIEPIRELAAYGSSVGRLNEMVSGIGEGAPTTKAIEAAGRRLTEAGKPIVGKPIEWAGQSMEAFARSFGAFIDVTKVELWKAYREITPKEQWGDVIRGIETQLLTSRMEGLGISRGQALVERVGLIAASYVRGSVNLIGGALTQPGVSGSIMRKAMGSMMITAPVLFYGVGKAIGMRDDELKERLNPGSSEFMMWRVPVGERNVNVGLGGIFKSYARLAGNVIKQAEENPKMMHMPFARWYQGHAGPLVSRGWEGFTGRDFMGNEITLPEIIGKSVLPMTAETLVSARSKEGGSSLADAAFGLAGLNAFPQSLGRQFMEERETMARTQFKKPYEKIPVGDQFRINVELRRKALFEERTEQTLPQKEAQARKELMRQKVINKQLPQEVQDRLEVLGVVLPAYEPSLRIGNQTMTFTKAQESAYQNLIVDEYTKNLPEILKNPKLDEATPKQRQEVIGMLAAKMRESAKLRLLKAINLEADKER